jgi:hypothetical protein
MWLAGAALLCLLVIFLSTYTAPFFFQFGRHYFAGVRLTTSAWYRCDPPGDRYCDIEQETLAAALWRDPRPADWWPVRFSFIRFD